MGVGSHDLALAVTVSILFSKSIQLTPSLTHPRPQLESERGRAALDALRRELAEATKRAEAAEMALKAMQRAHAEAVERAVVQVRGGRGWG